MTIALKTLVFVALLGTTLAAGLFGALYAWVF